MNETASTSGSNIPTEGTTMQTEKATKELFFPARFLARAKEKIAELGRRAKKIGLAEPTIRFIRTEKHTEYVMDPFGEMVGVLTDWAVVEVSTESIKIPGYAPVATIEWMDGSLLPLIYEWVGETAPKWARTAEPGRCDHCRQNRRRKRAFLLRETATDKIVQIGSTCVLEFLSITPEALVMSYQVRSIAEAMDDPDSLFEGVVRPREAILETFLATSAAFVRLYGYKKRDDDLDEPGTGAHAWWRYWRERNDPDLEDMETPEDRAFARRIIETIRERPMDGSTYESNLAAIVEMGYVGLRSRGYAASMVPWMMREDAANRRVEGLRHLGTEGKVLTVEAKLYSCTQREGSYGDTFLCKFRDGDGNEIVWWASKRPPVNAGEKVRLRGRVRRHDEFRGIPQTTMTRCKVL